MVMHGQWSLMRSGVTRIVCALLLGPAGSGKSSVIRVLAADLGLDLCEWRPSASMAWSEHQQQPARQQVLCDAR